VGQAGGPWPILRYEVMPIPEDLPPFDEVQDVVAEALDAIANLRIWFDSTGRQVLEQPPTRSLRRLIELTAALARQQGADELAGQLSALETRVLG